jgi:hypothetical protein
VSETVNGLLRLTADAWAAGALDSAERLFAGACRIVDGLELADFPEESNR